MDFVRYTWWWVRLKIDPTIFKISPEDKVDIAKRSEGLAEHIFFDEGKNDDLTMAHVSQILFEYLKYDRDYPKLKKRAPHPADRKSVDKRPLFLQTFFTTFERLLFTTDILSEEYSNNQLRNVFIAAGMLSENFRDKEMTQNDLDGLLHVMIWSLSTEQKIKLAKKYPRMAVKILFTEQLKLNLVDTDLKQIIDHYAAQENSLVMQELKKRSSHLLDDAEASEALAEAYIGAHLLTSEQIIEILPFHSVAFFEKHWQPLHQQLLLAGDESQTRTSSHLRHTLFKLLEDYCRVYNPSAINNSNSPSSTIPDHIINTLSEMAGELTIKDYINAEEYPALHRRINHWAYHSEIESSATSSLATTPRGLTGGNVTPRSLTPRSDYSNNDNAIRYTTPRDLSTHVGSKISRTQEVLQSKRASIFITKTGGIALEILNLLEKGDEQEVNDCLRRLKQYPDSLNTLFDIALMRNIPENLNLTELSKIITKSLLTYDPVCTYSIAELDLIAFLKKYNAGDDRDLLEPLFEYYSTIRPQNSLLINGLLITPYLRSIEKENYDIFYKLITSRGLTSENILLRENLFRKYENAKCLLGTPGVINTINRLFTSTIYRNNSEIRSRDYDKVKEYFPLLLKAAMNDSTEAKIFMADKELMTLLKKALSNDPVPEWHDSILPMNRKSIENELNFLTVYSAQQKNKNFFENDLIIYLLQNSFSKTIKSFASQQEMLSCISKITPIQTSPTMSNNNRSFQQEYLAVVNITFSQSLDGQKAKIASAKALQCEAKDLDDSFIVIPMKDIHSYLPEKLTANGVIPGHYSINTILEWDTPAKLEEKSINHNEFEKYFDTGIPPKPKSKLLIPQPDQRINELAERFKGELEIKETAGYKTLLWIKQKIITPFSELLTAIDQYIFTASAEKKALQEPVENRKANERIIGVPPPTLSLFPAAPKNGGSVIDATVKAKTAATTHSLVTIGINLEESPKSVQTVQQPSVKWTPPDISAGSPSTTINTELRIGRGKKS